MNYERLNNVSRTLIFRKSVPAGSSGTMEAPITAHGFIKSVRIRFAAGENGTLHIRPVVVIPQEIEIDLFNYAGDKYVSGDDETTSSSLKYEVENHSIAKIYYENTGTGTSEVNVDVEVEYYDIVEPKNIIG